MLVDITGDGFLSRTAETTFTHTHQIPGYEQTYVSPNLIFQLEGSLIIISKSKFVRQDDTTHLMCDVDPHIRTYLCDAGYSRKHRTINILPIGPSKWQFASLTIFCYFAMAIVY